MKVFQCCNCNQIFYEHNLNKIEDIEIFGDWSIVIGKGCIFECPDCESCEFVMFDDEATIEFKKGMREKYF